MTVRVGVIGTGAMGADHVRSLRGVVAGAAVEAVFDVDRDRAAAVAGGAHVFDDPYALIKDPDIDAVLIASSDATHEDYVLACIAAGKAVLCEKPLAPTTAGCLRIIDAEIAFGRRLVTVGFMRRCDDAYLQLKDVLRRKVIGTPLLIHCVHRNADVIDGFTSAMLVTSSAVHEVDITRWLLDEEIAAVSAHLPRPSRLAPAGLQDPQFLVLETESGVLVDIEVFVNARYGYDVRCEIVGETGTASLAVPTTALLRRDGVQQSGIARDFRDRFADAYRRERQEWIDGVAAGVAPGASAWDGYAAIAVAQACIEATATGERTVPRVVAKPPLYK